jgi:cobalt-zinc-cadmium efflux system membrane fusion protein
MGAYNPAVPYFLLQGCGLEKLTPKIGLARNRQLRLLAMGTAAVAALLVAVPAIRSSLSAKPTPPLPQFVDGGFRPDADQLSTMIMGTVATRAFPGLISAEASVASDDDISTQVFSPFGGQVRTIAVRAGDHVEKGQLLMTVTTPEGMQAQSDLIAASGAARAAKIAARNADDNEKRQHALYADGSAALKDWQQAQADQAAAQGTLRAANAALTTAQGKLRLLGFDDRQMQALARKSGGLSAVAHVVAPISGTVTQRLVGPGQFIQAGSATPVFAIGNFEKVWLVGNVREEDAAQMKPGETVNVTVFALRGRTFPARLSWVAPGVDPATHRLAVRAEMANPGNVLKPAMFASMDIHTGQDRVSPAVPEIAVIHEGDSAHVWVSGKGGSLKLRAIKPGRLQDGFVEVRDGLAPGDKVVLSGSIFLDSAARAD